MVRAELRELQQEGAAGLKAEQERSVSSVHKPAGSPEAALAGAADSPMLLYAEESVHSEESGIWISAVEGVAFFGLECSAVSLCRFGHQAEGFG